MVVQWVTSGPSHRTILRNRIQQQHLWSGCWWQRGHFSRLEEVWHADVQRCRPSLIFPSDVHPMGQWVSKCASFWPTWTWRFERRAVVPGFAPVLPFGHWKGGSWWIWGIWRDHLDVSFVHGPMDNGHFGADPCSGCRHLGKLGYPSHLPFSCASSHWASRPKAYPLPNMYSVYSCYLHVTVYGCIWEIWTRADIKNSLDTVTLAWLVAWLVPLASVASEAFPCPWTILGLLLSCACKRALWSWALCVTCPMPGAVRITCRVVTPSVTQFIKTPKYQVFDNHASIRIISLSFKREFPLAVCTQPWALTARPATYSIWADEVATSFPPCPRRTFSLQPQWA